MEASITESSIDWCPFHNGRNSLTAADLVSSSPNDDLFPLGTFVILLNENYRESTQVCTSKMGHSATAMPDYNMDIKIVLSQNLKNYECQGSSPTTIIFLTFLAFEIKFRTSSSIVSLCVIVNGPENKILTPTKPIPKEEKIFSWLFCNSELVKKGNSVPLSAKVAGHPSITVQWTLNDAVVTGQEYRHGVPTYKIKSEGNRHYFEIPEVLKPIAGRVTIVAENIAGRATSAAHLRVVGECSILYFLIYKIIAQLFVLFLLLSCCFLQLDKGM
ncbi:unnamed protein product, partial [Meganyctiphanes norvegica]